MHRTNENSLVDAEHRSQPTAMAPLVVDLDGTLTPSDTLVESIISLIKKNPYFIFQFAFWLLCGMPRSTIKRKIAERTEIAVANLPLREDFVTWLTEQFKSGRKIILATAAHSTIANSMAARLGLFDSVLSTNADINLKGSAKLDAIRQHIGPIFSYAGDSKADLPIWKESSTAILVNASPSVSRKINSAGRVEKEFKYPRATFHQWITALRIHQWLKNILIFVPLCAAFALNDIQKDTSAIVAFFSFSLTASATYILNDIWDLESDRVHPRKRNRAFASGRLSAVSGLITAAVLLSAGVATGFYLSAFFGWTVLGYIFLTTAYSWALKKYVLIDVIMLAILYTFRVLAGSVATGIQVTEWLLAFCIFTFLSLALVKRCAELVSLKQSSKIDTHGRDYQIGDLVVLWPLGIGASLCSIVVFGLYIGTPAAIAKYGNTKIL